MQNVLAAGGQKQDKTLSDSAMQWADSQEGFSHEGGIQFGFALNIEIHIMIDRVSISLSYLTAFKFTLFVRTNSIVSKHFSCYSASCKKCIFLEPRNRVTRPRRVDLSFPFLELLLCWLCKEEHGFLYGMFLRDSAIFQLEKRLSKYVLERLVMRKLRTVRPLNSKW